MTHLWRQSSHRRVGILRGIQPLRTRHFTGKQCAHCKAPQIGMAVVDQPDGTYLPLCHPDYGLDCYQLVTLHGHPMPCDCRGSSDHPDNDRCYRCDYRRFEHLVDPALRNDVIRHDFLGNPVPCWEFLERPVPPLPRAPF